MRVLKDDFGVYRDQASHLEKFESILKYLNESRITLSIEKIKLRFTTRHLAGHIISKEEIEIKPKKQEAILGAPFLTTKHEVRIFLQIMDYCRQFIQRYAMNTKLLTRFFKDDVPPLEATPDVLETFEKLKQKLLFAPILQT